MGELQKRIHKVYENDNDLNAYTYIDISKIVEEMTKDFPDIEKLAKTKEGKQAIELQEYNEILDDLYIQKVYEWLEKWLSK